MNPGLKRALESTKVWTAMGAVALSAAAAFGLPADKLTPVITGIVALAITVIGAIAYEDGAEKGNTGPVDPDPPLANELDASEK